MVWPRQAIIGLSRVTMGTDNMATHLSPANDNESHLAIHSINIDGDKIDIKQTLLLRVDDIVTSLESKMEDLDSNLIEVADMSQKKKQILLDTRNDIVHLIIGLKSNKVLLETELTQSSAADTYSSFLQYDIMLSEKLLSGGESKLIPIDPHARTTLQELFNNRQVAGREYQGMSGNEILVLTQTLYTQSSKLKREKIYIEASLEDQKRQMKEQVSGDSEDNIITTSIQYIKEMQAYIISLTNQLGLIDVKGTSEQKDLHTRVLSCIEDVNIFIDGARDMKLLALRQKKSEKFSGTHIGEDYE